MDRRHKFIISPEYNFIYYEIQKCATETLRKYFLGNKNRNRNPNKYGAVRISGGLSTVVPYRADGFYQFTFIRNPFERIVSAWLSKFPQYHDPKHPTLPGIRDPRLSLDTTFEEFVRFIAQIPDKKADCHFKSMHAFLPDIENGRVWTSDFTIGRVESLESDFNYIRVRIGLPLDPIPVENKTKKDKPWREYYTPELRDLVALRYAKDLKIFGYTFD